MPRDIDTITQRLKRELPDLEIAQLQVTHPADDDGLWFLRLPNSPNEIQLESGDGNCPFLIESHGSAKQLHGRTVDDVVAKVRIPCKAI